MKRLTLMFGLVFSMVIVASAAKKQVTLDYKKNSNDKELNKPHRAPEKIPEIFVTYDSDMQAVEIECDTTMDANVFLYAYSGDIIDYDTTLNTTLSTGGSTNCKITLYIESQTWTASAEIYI